MKYIVLARSFERKSKKQIPHYEKGLDPVEEIVNTDNNSLFFDLESEEEIKKAYESFWNDLNPRSKAIVLVDEVRPLEV